MLYFRYDFDKDGHVTKDDVTLLLSHSPISKLGIDKVITKEGQFTQSGGGGEEYIDRAESQKELNNLVDICFEGKTKLTFDDFKRIAESVSSEMFLCMFSLVKTHFPSLTQFKRYEQGLKKKVDTLLRSPNSARKLASPKVLSKFSTLSQMVKFSTPKMESKALRVEKSNDAESIEDTKELHSSKAALSKFGPKPKSSFAPSDAVDSPIGPTVRLLTPVKSKETSASAPPPDIALFCECGKTIVDFDRLLCADCLKQLTESKCEGYLSKCGKKGNKKYWVCIEKRELFSYEKKEATTHKSMHSLVGCFLKEEPAEKVDGQNVLPFTLVFSATKTKKYFTASKEEYQNWINYIKKTIGYASLLDYYDLKVLLFQE